MEGSFCLGRRSLLELMGINICGPTVSICQGWGEITAERMGASIMAYGKSFCFFIILLNAVARANEYNLRLFDTGQLTCPHEARPLRHPGLRVLLAITNDLPSLSHRRENQTCRSNAFSMPRIPATTQRTKSCFVITATNEHL